MPSPAGEAPGVLLFAVDIVTERADILRRCIGAVRTNVLISQLSRPPEGIDAGQLLRSAEIEVTAGH